MRIAFLAVLLAGAVYYTYVAFADFDFLTRTGRLGPGFFPRVIGVSAIVLILWTMADQMRATREPGGGARAWRDAVTLIGLAVGYAVLLRLFGGFVATILYLGIALTILNPGNPLKNAMLAILVPGGVYLLFDRILNANMPPALFNLPI
ncbi:MAG: tripartite tricarboxylate transporter TctB family protein [Pseudomonadota bacterium]